MDKKFQQVTIIISSYDLGGDRPIPPLDILCDLMVDSTAVDLIAIKDIQDMRLVVEED